MARFSPPWSVRFPIGFSTVSRNKSSGHSPLDEPKEREGDADGKHDPLGRRPLRKRDHVGKPEGEEVAEYVAEGERERDDSESTQRRRAKGRRKGDGENRDGVKKVEVEKCEAERVRRASGQPKGRGRKGPDDWIGEKKRGSSKGRHAGRLRYGCADWDGDEEPAFFRNEEGRPKVFPSPALIMDGIDPTRQTCVYAKKGAA